MRFPFEAIGLVSGGVWGVDANVFNDNNYFDPSTNLEIDIAANAYLLQKRALGDAPRGYTPADINCPAVRPEIRSAATLSPSEQTWLKSRRTAIVDPMKTLLSRMSITGLDTNAYIDSHKDDLPVVGIAMSGGGYRATLVGAGVIAAFDSRTENSTSKGHLGGLLQSATYLSGLSGGSWLVGSLYMNNFTTVQKLIQTPAKQSATGGLWQFTRTLLQGPDSGIISTAKYFMDIYTTVDAKETAGYNTTITDYWGRALSYQMINASDGAPAYTWSSVAESADFNNANSPLPIIVADGRAPGEKLISLNTTVFEFTPWEMGSFDPQLYGFAPLRYTGSNFLNGRLSNSDPCVRGFDNAGYVMATSSSLFNTFLLNIGSVDVPTVLKDVITKVLNRVGQKQEDIADWSPNPFRGWNVAKNPNAGTKALTLVDGGEDLQNIPVHPLIQPERHVDVIFAVDSSADTLGAGPNWPNGTALVATYARSKNADVQNGTAFPAIPDQNTFVNLGLNKRPTFFGCSTKNNTGPTPIIVYIPNAPYIYMSNVSTFVPTYSDSDRDAMVRNGYVVATMGNATVDAEWPACVGCAILSRSLERTKTVQPDVCSKCFQRYCWDGKVNSTVPNPSYQPQLILPNLKIETKGDGGGKKKSAAVGMGVPMVVVLGAVGVVAGLLV
ncbi:hypothetical protein EJ08DRAFT_640158 [Tothia fuscella]|uniref:Lysophospholipase n=1 Tax=Tothia fuscella TaxID=1048955 RepID=A0A9P4NIX8_9PEZI|nr:hypothetical protein EJ08DRAFT_640158 [Tothia fuscella]